MVIVTKRQLAQVWIDKDIWENMSLEQQNEANKEVREMLTSMLSYEPNTYQPERLNPETRKGSDSPNYMVTCRAEQK